MTRVLFHGSIEDFQDRIGDLIFRRLPDGTTVVSEAPPKMNSRQKKLAMKSAVPARKPIITVLQKRLIMPPLHPESSPYMRSWPPEIHRVQRRGGPIRVEATDNIQVARVRVTILDEDGRVLEKGECTKGTGKWWTFTSTVKGHTIIAEAWDLPRNVAKVVLK